MFFNSEKTSYLKQKLGEENESNVCENGLPGSIEWLSKQDLAPRVAFHRPNPTSWCSPILSANFETSDMGYNVFLRQTGIRIWRGNKMETVEL